LFFSESGIVEENDKKLSCYRETARRSLLFRTSPQGDFKRWRHGDVLLSVCLSVRLSVAVAEAAPPSRVSHIFLLREKLPREYGCGGRGLTHGVSKRATFVEKSSP